MLEQLSETDTLSGNEIDAALHAGLLTLDDDGNHIQVIEEGGMPFVVVWLACGAVFFTIFMKGVNFWGVRHAIEVVRGKFDNPDEEGEVTHMQAARFGTIGDRGVGKYCRCHDRHDHGRPWRILLDDDVWSLWYDQ